MCDECAKVKAKLTKMRKALEKVCSLVSHRPGNYFEAWGVVDVALSDEDGFGGTDYPDDFCEVCRIEGYSMCRCAERSPSPGPEFATCACEAGGRRLTEFSAPELHRPGCSRDFDPAPSACSVCGVGAGKHKPDCSRPPAPSAEPRPITATAVRVYEDSGWSSPAEVEARIAQAREEALREGFDMARHGIHIHGDGWVDFVDGLEDLERALKSKKEGA